MSNNIEVENEIGWYLTGEIDKQLAPLKIMAGYFWELYEKATVSKQDITMDEDRLMTITEALNGCIDNIVDVIKKDNAETDRKYIEQLKMVTA